MPRVKQVNHVAVVVDDMEKALSFWRDALGMELHELRDVPAEKSQVAFLPLPGSFSATSVRTRQGKRSGASAPKSSTTTPPRSTCGPPLPTRDSTQR